ncbi:MAG: homocysteine S-methyltransferase [Succinivibrio sp.]|nr:homocysteine S-methyltransferase [Succinivibrio sp.]
MLRIEDMLAGRKFVVLDGAFATELEGLGLNINDKLWSALALIAHQLLIKKVHLSYLQAGADIITSSSYQATVSAFVQKGLTVQKARELIGSSIRLAKEARDEFIASAQFDPQKRGKPQVAASLGPYGAYLADGSEYRGNYGISEKELKKFHAERMTIMAEESPDLFALETVPELDEAVAVAELMSDLKIEAPLWISFSCRDGEHISDGTEIARCAQELDRFDRVIALGVNCTHPKYVESLIRNIRKYSSKHVVVYPNSGESYDPLTKTWSGSMTEFLSNVANWYEAGATMIGGCCRTTPADIAKIAALSYEQEGI